MPEDQDQNPSSDSVEALASDLHEQWRASRRLPNGTYEPRLKDDGFGGQVDIANTPYSQLPEIRKAETRAGALSGIKAQELAENNQQFDKNGAPDIEFMSDRIHKDWLQRNESWAPPEQKLPYAQLSEADKEQDRLIARSAVARPKSNSTPTRPSASTSGSANKGASSSMPLSGLKKSGEAGAKQVGTEGVKKAGTEALKKTGSEGAKKLGTEAVQKAGGTADPKAQLLGTAQEAAGALKRGDGLGAADAGVRTAAVAGATALGGTMAGKAADFILKTKVGRKLTRAVTIGIGISLFLIFASMLMVVLVVGGAISSLTSGGSRAQSLYDPTKTQAISDPTMLITIDGIIKKNISSKLPIDDAVIATMDYLAKGGEVVGSSSSSGNTPFSISVFYTDIIKNKISETGSPTTASSGNRRYPFTTLVPGTSATSAAPWDAIGLIDPTLSQYTALESALFYETAYKTIVNELTTNKIFKSNASLANQVSDWSPALQALITQDGILSNGTISSPFDSSTGNLISTGILVDPHSQFKDGPPLGPGNLFSLDYAYSLIGHASLVCPDGHCDFQCEKIAEHVYHKVGIFDPAYNGWRWMVVNGYATKASDPNGMSPPPGALMFWDPTPSPGATGRDGHIGVYLGGGLVLSNWDNGDGKGLNIWAVKASEMFNSRWPYLGWSYPKFPGKAPLGYNNGQ